MQLAPLLHGGSSEPAFRSLAPFVAADANILINMCRLSAQRYYFAYQEQMPVEQLVRSVCDTKQVLELESDPESRPSV